MRMGREGSSPVRKLMVTKSWPNTLSRAPMDMHLRTKCDTCIWFDRQDKTVGDSNHVVKSKQSVSPLKHKSENMILLGGKSNPHDPGKVTKRENRKPNHISTLNKNHRRISYNPISASTYRNPLAKSVSNYYNLAHYNNGDALPSHGVKPTWGFHKVKLRKVETWRHTPGCQL
jgi:hypothetical protein